MKKEYISPMIEIVCFDEDVITASNSYEGDFDVDENPISIDLLR